ncbi:MAG: S-layer homology domain-containing protein [Oscillospiraceae bacterium]|nr:S-layer homology domain-containing protein [Oscillospiraceae bacterium]
MKRSVLPRILAVLLLLSLTLTLAVLPVSAQQQWNMEYFLKKYSDPHFDLTVQPNRVMSVEEFIAVIYAYSYYGDGAASVTAKDRSGKLPSAWAGRYVQAEVSKGVVTPAALRWSQPATDAFAAEYLCRAKGKYSYDAVNAYSFTGTDGLTADQKLYLDCAVDWGLIPYTPGMNVSQPILRKDARRYEVPTGQPTCRAAQTAAATTMREQHGYFVDCYWDLDKAAEQFSMLQALQNHVTMVTFQCGYWNGSSASGTLSCDVNHAEAVAHSDRYTVDPQLDAISWCKESGRLTFLGISNALENGFTAAPVRAILAGNTEAAADEIVDAVTKYGLDGVNMGIELGADSRDLRSAYAQFLTLLGTKLHAKGKLLLTTVGACFTDAQEQAGFYDYDTIGKASDYVHVILYDDYNDTGYPTRKTDGAVSNLTRFGRCLRYAAKKMPREKLLAGLGAYATDYNTTAITAEDISYAEAERRRSSAGATLNWNSEHNSAVFTYTADGANHRVWMESAASLAARAKLVNQYNLCGTSFYYIGTGAPQLFRSVSELSSYKPEIMTALREKLIPTALRKCYNSPITRREFCSMIAAFLEARPAALPAQTPAAFSDCKDPDVLTAASYGIVNGYTGGVFRPNNTITRQEAATMLMRLAKTVGTTKPNGESLQFKELSTMQSWAKDGVSFVSACTDPVSGKRVMNGTGKDAFSPLATYTREQSAMTMIRLFHATA